MWTTLQKLLLAVSAKSSNASSHAIDRIFGGQFFGHFHTDPRWFIHADFRKNHPRSRSAQIVDSESRTLTYNRLKWYTTVNNPAQSVYNLKIQTEIDRFFNGFNSPITIMRFTLKKRFNSYGV
ncbi:MAG: hypothetical protein ACON34_00510 [Flavobacteriales bacterium]